MRPFGALYRIYSNLVHHPKDPNKGKNLLLTQRLPFGETIWVLILNPYMGYHLVKTILVRPIEYQIERQRLEIQVVDKYYTDCVANKLRNLVLQTYKA